MRPFGIHPTCVIGDPPEHRDYHQGDDYLRPEISDSALLDAFCTVDGGLEEPTRIGARTFLNARVHIGHDAQIGADCEFGAGVVICGHVRVGDGVRIGGNSWVRPRITVGAGARIGGGSVVVKDVPAGEVWAGNPARPLTRGLVAESMAESSAEKRQITASTRSAETLRQVRT